MLKRLLTMLFILSGLSAFAADNYLNSIVVENGDSGYSIIFRADDITKIKKDIESSNRVILTLKNIKQSSDINTLYKNVPEANGLIIQNFGNDLKVFIEAKDISKAQVVFETPNSAPITVSDNKDIGRIIWSLCSVLILFAVMHSAKNASAGPKQKDINEIIKEREKAMYKNFQKEISTLPSMHYKLKSYSKHVLKGETIRSYESRMSRL